MAGDIMVAFPVALLLFSEKSGLLRSLGVLVGVSVTLFQILAYHYEAIFGHLPGANLFFYLGEIPHLAPSLHANLSASLL